MKAWTQASDEQGVVGTERPLSFEQGPHALSARLRPDYPLPAASPRIRLCFTGRDESKSLATLLQQNPAHRTPEAMPQPSTTSFESRYSAARLFTAKR